MFSPRYDHERCCNITLDPCAVVDRCHAVAAQAQVDLARGPKWSCADRLRGEPCVRFTQSEQFIVTALDLQANHASLLPLPVALEHQHLVAGTFRGFADDGRLVVLGLLARCLDPYQNPASDALNFLQSSSDVSLLFAYDRHGRFLDMHV